MNELYHGGPAFPGVTVNDSDANLIDPFGTLLPPAAQATYSGATLRDYFMAHVQPPESIGRAWGEAMVGPYPKGEDGFDAEFGRETILWWAAVDAEWRSVQADAMLKARQS